MRPQGKRKGARCQLSIEGLGGTVARKLSCALAALLAIRKQDITRTDNHYTNFQTLPKEVSTFAYGIKSCLPFIVMSVGYAEF